MRARFRIAFIVALAILEVAAAAAAIASYDQPIGTYGFLTTRDDAAFAVVGKDSPAAQAGIVVGDRLLYATLPLRGRRFVAFEEAVPAGAAITFTIVHAGRERIVTLRAQAQPTAGHVETLTYALAGLALGLVGLGLVLVRPSRMTWAFALIAPALLTPWPVIFWTQETFGVAPALVDAAVALSYAIQTAAIMVFAGRFPDDRPRGIAAVVDRLALPVGVLVAAIYLYAYMMVRFSPVPPVQILSLADWAIVLPSAAAMVALIATYVSTPGAVRTRLVPVIASFIVLIVTGVVQQLGGEWTTNGNLLLAIGIAFSASPALVAGAVAYGVIRHRVMDVSFIISRTLVYTVLTLAAVASFTLIEYVFGKLLESQGVATLLNIFAAVGLGVSFNVVHAKLDGWIDRVLFRRRYLAEARLAAIGRDLQQATTADAVDAALVNEPADAFGLASAALFRHDGNGYRRTHAFAWQEDEAATLQEDDPLALRLRSDGTAIDPQELHLTRTDLPGGERQALYAVPVLTGNRLAAIALYGGHRTGEDLDPDERRSLRRLAAAAAAAYDHITAARLRERLDNLEIENATLRGVERKLSELLGRRLS